MTPSPPENDEQVHRYLAEVLGTDRPFAVYPCEYGWVCQQQLTDDELAAGMGMGLGNYVVDRRTGAVTAHTSLHPLTIGEQYDEDVRAGNPVRGYQLYPPLWEIDMHRVADTPAEVRYRVTARSLAEPPAEEPSEHLLTIDKQNYYYSTDSEVTHTACGHAVVWAEQQGRPSGEWPESGTFRA
ncbi:hypothetical protein [Nocardia asteroides]|uniref:hypothetical protein n=1 Tax=Nocardia asteroides TaxID=1824 RepID=UPI001E2A74D1|nr:hypothetical protein [Nocardia asteroides]UGT60563.1 hypothetical protein LTT61_25830 [Nocardia asteroides]